MSIKNLRNKLEGERGKQTIISQQITTLKHRRRDLKRSLRRHEQAREIIREVGLKTQQQLQYHISDITSLALDSVFSDPYQLVVEFVERRNKTECDLWFERNGERVNPMDATGGGAVDVASFALRVASWSMRRPRTRPVMILDEPMKNISVSYRERASAMIKQVSDKLGIQFIIITHEPTLAAEADQVFEVKQRNRITQVK